MSLQSYTLSVGNLQDDGSGNNYAVNKPVYILKQDRTLQPIYSDFYGATPIIQDGLNNVTDNRGQFTFFVESGDYMASVGGIDRTFTVVGSDYFNNKVDEAVDLIIDTVSGRGAYYVVGSFEDGFTYTDINQTGTYNNSGTLEYYVFTGGLDDLDHVVTAGTNPTNNSDYARVNYNQSSQVINDDGSTAQDTANLVRASLKSPSDNGDNVEFLSCIPRVNSSGLLSFVDDSDHNTIGFSSINKVGDFIMRVNYSKTYKEVNNLSITIDDELCKYGVFTGGSVGTSYTDFTAYTQLRGVVDTNDMTFKSTGILPDSNAVSVSYVDDVLIIDHDNAAFSNDSVVVSQQYGLSFMTKYGVGQSASQINIIPWTEFSGYITYDGSNFINDPNKPWLISNTQAGITMSWDAAVNALKVTHPLANDYVVHATAALGGYSELNVDVVSSNEFMVYFFNSSGAQVNTPDTNMKLMISRPSCQVRGVIPGGAKFNLRAGIIPIRSANIGAASGNNFWINGLMSNPI